MFLKVLFLILIASIINFGYGYYFGFNAGKKAVLNQVKAALEEAQAEIEKLKEIAKRKGE